MFDSITAAAARLVLILAIHGGLLLVLKNCASPPQALGEEMKTVFVSFVASPAPQSAAVQPPAPEPKPEPPQPRPAPKPKPQPKAEQPVSRPVEPAVVAEPSPRAIEMPPAAAMPPASSTPPAAFVAAAPAAMATAAAPPRVPPTITSGIQYLQAPAPEYPAAARRMGEEEQVVMRVLVNERGRPERVEVQRTSGSMRLDEAARRAVLRALFKPHIEDGRPVSVFAIIPVQFELDR